MSTSHARRERRNQHAVVDHYIDEQGHAYYIDCPICKELGQAINQHGEIRKVDTLTAIYRTRTTLEALLEELHNNITWEDDENTEGNNEVEEELRELVSRAYAEGLKDGMNEATKLNAKPASKMHAHK
jgi:flagellar biosynthesis/type III secretory pathway protein FliH